VTSSHALACAGIIEQGKWFDPELTIDTVEKEESRLTLDVNLVGTCMFARIAVVYLKHEKKQGEDKSLTLISSAAGFRESPGLWMYQVRAAALRHLSGLLPYRNSPLLEYLLISTVFQAWRDGPYAYAPQDDLPTRRNAN
jgi:NAD(P)-dependent dehydrogenase (short-subunit alcohol dehydrogenase family)